MLRVVGALYCDLDASEAAAARLPDGGLEAE
jgi:hypothetical protein